MFAHAGNFNGDLSEWHLAGYTTINHGQEAHGAAGPVIHPHGQHARGQIATTLTKKGIPCAECVIYDQIETPLSIQARALLTQPQALLVPVFSPRSARLLQRYGPLPNQLGWRNP